MGDRMDQLATDIVIDAKPDRVWRHLASFAEYGEWNPFITSISGELSLGEIEAVLSLKTNDDRGQFRHAVSARLVRLEHELEIRWEHGLWLPGLMTTEHWFRIAPRKGGVRFHQGMKVTGLLSHSLKGDFFGPFEAGFIAMNQALRDRTEACPTRAQVEPDFANDNAGKLPPTSTRRSPELAAAF
jgi:hypothetical protein